MTPTVVAAILCAACFNATWNMLVKGGADKLLGSILVSVGCGLIAIVLLPFAPPIDAAAWPFIVGSVSAQVIYINLLAAAYGAGDMSQTYPLMRGVAPLLVALASGPVMGEGLSTGRWIGVGLISSGVISTALTRPETLARRWAAPGFALLNACAIATYTTIDGLGVRRSGHPFSYALWTFTICAVPLAMQAVVLRRSSLVPYVRRNWPIAMIGGAATFGSYSIVLWAMSAAPVAIVASLRETSILFATVLSAVVLKERIAPARSVGIVLIVCGAAMIRGLG